MLPTSCATLLINRFLYEISTTSSDLRVDHVAGRAHGCRTKLARGTDAAQPLRVEADTVGYRQMEGHIAVDGPRKAVGLGMCIDFVEELLTSDNLVYWS